MAAAKVFLTPAELSAARDKHKAATLGVYDKTVRDRFIAKRNDTTTAAPLGAKDLEFYTADAADQILRELKDAGWASVVTPYLHEHDAKCRNEKGALMCARHTDSTGIFGDDAIPFWSLSVPQPFVPQQPKPIIERASDSHGGPPPDSTDAKDSAK